MRRSDLPAKNDDAVLITIRVTALAGKSDRRTARSYKGVMVIVQPR